MKLPQRTFEDRPAARKSVPLLLGIVGPSSSGKTFSALRLAAGMQRVIGGDIFGIDTEAGRMAHYADRFKFRHVPFAPPFGPLDYLAAVEHCIAKGARILVIDSMTHEHSGPGGVTDQAETFLDEKCGSDWKRRQAMQMLSYVAPKQQRKRLNARIVQLGINAIFCYRAHEKLRPVKGEEPEKLGWQPETTSTLHYDMTQRFLLTPGSDGCPSFFPEKEEEKRLVKNPVQFRDWFKTGTQLSEDIGERLARWAAGDSGPTLDEQLLAAASSTELAAVWSRVPKADQARLLPVKDRRKAELANAVAKPGGEYTPGIDDPALEDTQGR